MGNSALNIRIEGLEKVIKNLSDLDKIKIPSAMNSALDNSSNLVLSTMRSNTPIDTGNLKDSERIVVGANRREIGPDSSLADYAYYVERGHHTRSGSWVPGQFYVMRTAVETRNSIISYFKQALRAFIK